MADPSASADASKVVVDASLGVSGDGVKVVNNASTKTGDVATGPPTAPGADHPDPPSDKSVKMELRGHVVSKGKIVHQKCASGGSQVGVIPKVVDKVVDDEDDDDIPDGALDDLADALCDFDASAILGGVESHVGEPEDVDDSVDVPGHVYLGAGVYTPEDIPGTVIWFSTSVSREQAIAQRRMMLRCIAELDDIIDDEVPKVPIPSLKKKSLEHSSGTEKKSVKSGSGKKKSVELGSGKKSQKGDASPSISMEKTSGSSAAPLPSKGKGKSKSVDDVEYVPSSSSDESSDGDYSSEDDHSSSDEDGSGDDHVSASPSPTVAPISVASPVLSCAPSLKVQVVHVVTGAKIEIDLAVIHCYRAMVKYYKICSRSQAKGVKDKFKACMKTLQRADAWDINPVPCQRCADFRWQCVQGKKNCVTCQAYGGRSQYHRDDAKKADEKAHALNDAFTSTVDNLVKFVSDVCHIQLSEPIVHHIVSSLDPLSKLLHIAKKVMTKKGLQAMRKRANRLQLMRDSYGVVPSVHSGADKFMKQHLIEQAAQSYGMMFGGGSVVGPSSMTALTWPGVSTPVRMLGAPPSTPMVTPPAPPAITSVPGETPSSTKKGGKKRKRDGASSGSKKAHKQHASSPKSESGEE